uniref:Uncharacterized protein n=1 Tax=Anguilla anguilla TaxID=7936 RepID=A0A0E9QRB6_ANGAN
MSSALYQKILMKYVCQLKRKWFLQQNNDPKHKSKSTSDWLSRTKFWSVLVKVLTRTQCRCCGRT